MAACYCICTRPLEAHRLLEHNQLTGRSNEDYLALYSMTQAWPWCLNRSSCNQARALDLIEAEGAALQGVSSPGIESSWLGVFTTFTALHSSLSLPVSHHSTLFNFSTSCCILPFLHIVSYTHAYRATISLLRIPQYWYIVGPIYLLSPASPCRPLFSFHPPT